MTECIVEIAGEIPSWAEPIVRCGDCVKWRFFDIENGVRFGTCDEWKRADSYVSPATREDGYCAWAKRRDA